MAMSDENKRILGIALGDKTAAEEIAGVVDVADVADLNQTISGTYTQAEVQAISDKVDELLAALRAAGLMS